MKIKRIKQLTPIPTLLPILALTLGLTLSGTGAGVAQAQSTLSTTNSGIQGRLTVPNTFWQKVSQVTTGRSSSNVLSSQALTGIEMRLYGRSYLQNNETAEKRLSRIEKSLYGGNFQGTLPERFQRVQLTLQRADAQGKAPQTERSLEFIEQRVFQQTFSQWPLPKRLDQLEEALYGQKNTTDTVPDRLKRLTYQTPIEARQIRLVSSSAQPESFSERMSGSLSENFSGKPKPPISKKPIPAPPASTVTRDEPFRPYAKAPYKASQSEQAIGQQPSSVPVVTMSNLGSNTGQAVSKPIIEKTLFHLQETEVPAAISSDALDATNNAKGFSEVPPVPKPFAQTPVQQTLPQSEPLVNPLSTTTLASASPPVPSAAAPKISQEITQGITDTTGRYANLMHDFLHGKTLRWAELPVYVFSKPVITASNNQASNIQTQSIQAIEAGLRQINSQLSSLVPIVFTTNQDQADVIFDWNQPAGAGQPITGLMMTLTLKQSIRPVVVVRMQSLFSQNDTSSLSPAALQHAVLHQLGHALGLWGHSLDPSDVMFPASRAELNDIPDQWNLKRFEWYDVLGTQPRLVTDFSAQDLNTLKAVYQQPAQDLRTYSPY